MAVTSFAFNAVAVDVGPINGRNEIYGYASVTEASDVVLITADASITAAGDTAQAEVTVIVTGDAAISQAGDTVQSATGFIVTADSSITAAGDSVIAHCKSGLFDPRQLASLSARDIHSGLAPRQHSASLVQRNL